MTRCPVAYPSVEGAECPYPFYSWAREEQPVYQLPGLPYYFITRYEDLVYATDHPEIFSSMGRTLGAQPVPQPMTASGLEIRTMIESDAPYHKQHRKYAAELFTPKALNSYRPMVLELVTKLIDDFVDRGECDFVEEFANKLPALVTARFAGFPDDILDQLNAWGQIEASGAPFLPAERFEEHTRVRASMRDYVQTVLQARVDQRGVDGLSRLVDLQVERDGELSLPYVLAQSLIILGGGTTTTAHMLGMAMLLLLQNPDALRRVTEDKKQIRLFLDEALRLEAPVQWVPRRVVQDVELSGTVIPMGSHVLLGFASANRDPERFADPDGFDMDRKSGSGVTFGRGPHSCLGLPLARLELTIAFEELLTRLAGLKLAPGQDIRHIDSPSFRGLRNLRITFDRAA